MRFDLVTEKAREAIIEAQSEAQEYRHASIDFSVVAALELMPALQVSG